MVATVGPLTARVFDSLNSNALTSVGGAGGTSQLESLLKLDAELQELHAGRWPPPPTNDFVRRMDALLRPDSQDYYDVAVCGGTLGILLACALQLQGHRVAVIEAGPLRGRQQDWNTSEEELEALVAAGVLARDELAEVAPLSFGPMRCAFGPSPSFELKLAGVLDVAVSPEALLRCVRKRFEAAGGRVLEFTRVQQVDVHEDGAKLVLNEKEINVRLVVDCMGHRSPIALQQRGGQKPDGVCVQVGCCATADGFAQWGQTGDFFCTAGDASAGGPSGRARVQHFWQAFPTSSDEENERSTYMFTYLKPSPEMPSLVDTLEAFWTALPGYQRLDGREDPLAELIVSRVVFGWFPTYRRNAPLQPSFDRILSVGDASAVQSPISFGGFCAMLRHLPRLRSGIDLALRSDSLSRDELALLAPYLPNLSSAWMSSAAMTARPYADRAPPSPIVNQLLEGNFKVMSELPRKEAITFFRDVTTLKTLTAVLVGQTLTMATLLPSVVAEIGALEIGEFGLHLMMLAVYTGLHTVSPDEPLPATGEVSGEDYRRSCYRDAWRYGSGLD